MLCRRLPFSSIILLALSPAIALASPEATDLGASEPPQEEPGRAAKHGSHFFLEGGVGFGVIGNSGPVFSGMLGAGGRVPGSPLRLYLVAELARTSGEALAPSSANTSPLLDYVSTDVSLGLRGYLPVYGRLRFFADALVGRNLTEISPDPSGRGRDWATVLTLATGLQLRVIDELSCGARGRLALVDSEGFLAQVADERWSVGGVVTAHF